MALTAREIEAFLEGQAVSAEVVTEITSQLQDPQSLASVIGHRLHRAAMLFASGDSPMPAIDPPVVDSTIEELQALNQEWTKLFQEKRWPEALELRLTTCRLALRYLGSENRDTCTYVNSVGKILLEMRQFERAARVFQSAVELRTKAMGERHSDTGISWSGLGRALEGVGDYQEARECHRLALEITEETLGPNHPDTGVSLSDLGLVSLALNDFETARSCFARALEIAREIDGEKDPVYGGALIHMGCVEEATGDLESAESNYRKAYKVMLDARGPYHDDVAWALNQLGGVLLSKKRFAEALGELEIAANILEQLADNLFLSVSVLSNLAIAQSMAGDSLAAAQSYGKGFDVCQALYGPEHVQTQTMARNLDVLDGSLRMVPRKQIALKSKYLLENGKAASVFELLAA